MEELLSNKAVLKYETHSTEYGFLTILQNQNGVVPIDNINIGNNTIISLKIYKESNTIKDKVIYVILDSNGTIFDILEDKERILGHPKFFKTVDDEPWVLITILPNEKEIPLPLFNRDRLEVPKGKREFVGKFIGNINNMALLYSKDWFDNERPDKLRTITFKDGVIKSDKNVKIQPPIGNKVYVNGDNIHLLKKERDHVIHRMLDTKGEVLQERKISCEIQGITEVCNLDFNNNSYFVFYKGNQMFHCTISKDGEVEVKELFAIDFDFYNLEVEEKISHNTLLFRFTFEKGNGWFVVRGDNLIQCFISNKSNSYIDRVSNQRIDLPYENLILRGINKSVENGYCINFYRQTEYPLKSDVTVIINIKL
ncbi:hypothetical protein [Cytobacillus sp. IB215316]|uniref:hypothetical protein n=1 Tax=Cytobacillus sp. IB215316 TaxID=3097354 RepID=UPI002A177D1C|nr:hypothetical protein [Cytobacillus sp. IB215316]MDX8363480.1 hypothetical protein [Cytobacillus sp. IB215316]